MFSFKLQTLILRLPGISRGPSSSTGGNTKQVDTKFAGRTLMHVQQLRMPQPLELCKLSWNHRISLVGRDPQRSLNWPLCRTPQESHLCLRVLSKYFLNSVRLGVVITALGSCSRAGSHSGGRTFC